MKMRNFTGRTLRWEWREGVVELTLDHAPANEIGTAMLAELEKFVASFESLAPETSVCIFVSAKKSVFSAGGDLLFTGRTVNATRAQTIGLVAQLAGEGEALRIARSTAAQIIKYDAVTRAAAKKFIKPIPHDELRREIDLFCELFTRPAVMAALKKFVEDSGPMPYLP